MRSTAAYPQQGVPLLNAARADLSKREFELQETDADRTDLVLAGVAVASGVYASSTAAIRRVDAALYRAEA